MTTQAQQVLESLGEDQDSRGMPILSQNRQGQISKATARQSNKNSKEA